MKKSKTLILSAVFIAAISVVSCEQKPADQWLTTQERKDTVYNNQPYRYYGGYWYPLYYGRFNPGLYNGYTASEFSSHPSIKPTMRSSSGFGESHSSSHSGVRSGGFGSSSHGFSSGE